MPQRTRLTDQLKNQSKGVRISSAGACRRRSCPPRCRGARRGGFRLAASRRPLRGRLRPSSRAGLAFGAHQAEALPDDRPHRRHVVHVVHERPAAERQVLAGPGRQEVPGRLRNESLLPVESPADAVDVPGRTRPRPAAIHARLEVERRVREKERQEVPPHGEVRLAADVERVEAGMRRRRSTFAMPSYAASRNASTNEPASASCAMRARAPSRPW